MQKLDCKKCNTGCKAKFSHPVAGPAIVECGLWARPSCPSSPDKMTIRLPNVGVEKAPGRDGSNKLPARNPPPISVPPAR
eukprot:scaffold175434_cov16-Prasinocladus_malaysianus.AAC.1